MPSVVIASFVASLKPSVVLIEAVKFLMQSEVFAQRVYVDLHLPEKG